MNTKIASLIHSLETKKYINAKERKEIIHLLKNIKEEGKTVEEEIEEVMTLFQTLGYERNF
jgi:uncharacterized protein (UPF0335 family)